VYAVLMLGGDGRLVLRTPYDPGFVEALKDAIPYAYREWDKPCKVWRIAPEWGDIVCRIVQADGGILVDKRPAPAPRIPPALGEARSRLHVTPDAPVQVAIAAYKALARLHHPDVGGDLVAMQALNDAIETFKNLKGDGHDVRYGARST
jgi:hypothetical protein